MVYRIKRIETLKPKEEIAKKYLDNLFNRGMRWVLELDGTIIGYYKTKSEAESIKNINKIKRFL